MSAHSSQVQQQLSYLLSQLWVLDHETGQVVNPTSFNAWLAQAKGGRDIAKTEITNAVTGNAVVSTVFLPLNPTEHEELFETMILGGKYDGYCRTYATMQLAKAGHKDIVDDILQGRIHDSRIDQED